MVYIPHIPGDKLTAYLTTTLTPAQIEHIDKSFFRGAHGQYPTPAAQLEIVDKPEYRDLSHAEIRRAETEAGNTGPFLVIDSRTPEDDAVWYIDQFATEDEVEDEEAESTDVLWKGRIAVVAVPIMHANYSISNGTLAEDLSNIVDLPFTNETEQERLITSGLDPDEEARNQPCWITAEPDDVEWTTDLEIRKTTSSRPDKMVRLKEEVAKSNGLVNRWSIAQRARDVTLPDGSVKKFPEGSCVLQLKYDADFPWGEEKKSA